MSAADSTSTPLKPPNAAPDFAGRWIVVSGASSGIGRAISEQLVHANARVVLIGRDIERLQETARLAGGPECTRVLPLDLARLETISPGLAALAGSLGSIYGLVHAAGVALTLPLSALKPERVRAVLDVNLLAGLELCRAVTRRELMGAGEGSLLWIASVYGHVGAPGQVAYCASKGAVLAAMRALALELAPRGIRVNALSPGYVATAMTQSPASRLSAEQWEAIAARHPLGTGTTQDAARAAVFLLDPRNTWTTGTDLIMDGGYTVQ